MSCLQSPPKCVRETETNAPQCSVSWGPCARGSVLTCSRPVPSVSMVPYDETYSLFIFSLQLTRNETSQSVKTHSLLNSWQPCGYKTLDYHLFQLWTLVSTRHRLSNVTSPSSLIPTKIWRRLVRQSCQEKQHLGRFFKLSLMFW